MDTKYIVLLVIAAVLSLLLLAQTYGRCNEKVTDDRALEPESLVPGLSLLSLEERQLFIGQQEKYQTNDPKHWLADGADSTLRQVFLLARHGDRTPTVFPARDPLKDEPLWKLHGISGLTNLGKARQSLLGRLVRYRYRPFLGDSVNKHIRTSKSSARPRCIESAQAFLSSFLALTPPDSRDAASLQWDVGADMPAARLWQPANIETLPVAMDGLLAYSNCKAQIRNKELEVGQSESIRRLLADFQPLGERLNASIGQRFDDFGDIEDASDLALSESFYFPTRMDKTLREAKDRLLSATETIFAARQKPELSRRLLSGLLVNELLGNMRLTQLDDPRKATKFMHYSTHDFNLGTLMECLGVWSQVNKVPDYASNLVLELHESPSSGWSVRLFYMQKVPSNWVELRVPNCKRTDSSGWCSLDELERLVAKYRLTSWQQWMSECNNSYTDLHPFGEDKFFAL